MQHIDEIGIKSSFFNSELTKLVTLIVKDVRINKDICQNGPDNYDFQNLAEKSIDFRGKKIPNIITTFAQFMAVDFYNISAILLHTGSPGYLIHTSVNKLYLDGSVVQNARSLLVNVDLTEGCAKVLRHNQKQIEDGSCLAEINFAVIMEATLMAQGPLSVEVSFNVVL